MSWSAYFHPKFKEEVEELSEAVQDGLAAALAPLRKFGPSLGRPDVDTLNGSKYANMKELRFRAAGGVWRVAFAFNPRAMQFCSLLRTNRARAKRNSTSGLSKGPILGTRNTLTTVDQKEWLRCVE